MPTRITENDLFLPALYVINRYTKANTTKIKEILMEAFRPVGEDAAILPGRSDNKFSQKVRNLMGSHYNTNGMAENAVKDNRGYFTLTARGKKAVEDNLPYLQYLFDNTFAYEDITKLAEKVFEQQAKKQKIIIYDENIIVSEGAAAVKSGVVRERSKKLRDAAIRHYTQNGRIKCAACGFDFQEKYGERGSGYIQIHHEKPIYQYANDGVSTYIQDAVQYTKPVCANCHCMIHRNKSCILSIADIQEIIEQTSQL